MTSVAKSGGPPIGSPAFYFKQLYVGAEGWTVSRVACKLGYREQKVLAILGRIPPGMMNLRSQKTIEIVALACPPW